MICGAIVAALSLFFKADQIFVTGASRYSQQQVLQASGIRQGGNLFLLNKHQAAAAITDQLPYVESVRIRRQLPNALRIDSNILNFHYFLIHHFSYKHMFRHRMPPNTKYL